MMTTNMYAIGDTNNVRCHTRQGMSSLSCTHNFSLSYTYIPEEGGGCYKPFEWIVTKMSGNENCCIFRSLGTHSPVMRSQQQAGMIFPSVYLILLCVSTGDPLTHAGNRKRHLGVQGMLYGAVQIADICHRCNEDIHSG